MAKQKISTEIIIKASAEQANQFGLENLSLKSLAETLNIKSPSLYNHISSLEELKSLLMIYGWTQMEKQMVDSVIGVSGYEALKNMCEAFYHYATTNKGVFDAMLWYNKYDSEEKNNATSKLFQIVFKILKPLHISEANINHILRTLISFLEGYSLLVNNQAFGNPISIKESFDVSLNIIINGIKSLEGVN